MIERLDAAAGPFCCSEPQAVLLVDYFLYIAVCLLLWHSRVLLPLKLLTVFLHELGHALGAWAMCGSVHGIEVHANQGGVTHWSVSSTRMKMAQHVVLPAGYLGSAAWGGAILVACARPETTRVMAFVLMFFLLLALGYSCCGKSSEKRDWTLSALSLGVLVLLAGLLYVCYQTSWPYRDLLLNKVLLLIGTMNMLFATYDIWEDCISRTVERSDAYKYSQLIGCATPKCVGVFWFLLSLIMALALLGLALLWTPHGQPVTSFEDFSTFSRICMLVPAVVLVAAVVFRLCCSQTYGGRVTRGVTLQKEDESAGVAMIEAGEALKRAESSGEEESEDGGEKVVYMSTGTHAATDDRGDSSSEGSSTDS
eukprot:TRINITY_DN64128_c0_g1_i1.p1 TRINITY_DN64128_c0_g1~~TRINITY_DN64128_c0_g1_i1.p1  ORF type:complete len:377 (+),score=77.93 TRINITY_DN64128_c0_g1_i1:31-1131(+)